MSNKDELLTRLIKEGHINLEEAMLLMETQQEEENNAPWYDAPYGQRYKRIPERPMEPSN